jgi:Fur family zinc uptake transcriptional regulator
MTAFVSAGATSAFPHAPQSGAMKRNDRLVLEALRRAGRPLKAYHVLESLSDAGFRAPMTVYRALGSLVAQGLVRKIVGMNAFAAVASPSSAIMICVECGAHFETPMPEGALASLFPGDGVLISTAVVEAYGRCGRRECRAAPGAAATGVDFPG